MGRAHCLVSPELRGKLYDAAARGGPIFILDDEPFGDGTHHLHVVSDLLGHGYQGCQSVVVEGDEFRFVKDCDV